MMHRASGIEKKDLIDPNNTRRYYYNYKWQVLCEYNGSDEFQQWYAYGNYIDEVLAMGTGIFASTARYYIHDHLYSPVALTDYSGNVLERYEYDAYGNCYVMDSSYNPRTESSYGNPYYFTGRRWDELDNGSLKLMYYRNRYYDTYTGRFTTQDPLGIKPNSQLPNVFDILNQYDNIVNIYIYALNNPILLNDPFGLKPKCKADGFAIMAWVALPKGTSLDKYTDDLKIIKLTSKLTLLHDLLSPWKEGVFSFAWDLAAGSVGETYYRRMVELHVGLCGGNHYALVCEWSCISGKSYFDDCVWAKCKSEDKCEWIPDRRKCERRIIDWFFKKDFKFHVPFTWSDYKKVLKKINRGADVDKVPY